MSGRHGHKHKGKKKEKGSPLAIESNNQTPTEIGEAKPESSDHRGAIVQMKTVSKPDRSDLALWSLILTAIIAFIYYFQLRSMQDSVKATYVGLRVDQRPWIKIATQPQDIQFEVDQPVIQKTTFTNIGKSPALKFWVEASFEIVDVGRLPTFDFGKNHPEAKIPLMLPSDPYPSILPWLAPGDRPMRLSQQGHQAVYSGSALFLMFAHMTYDDNFGGHHFQNFCNWMDPPGTFLGRSFQIPNDAYKGCTEYNSADSDKP